MVKRPITWVGPGRAVHATVAPGTPEQLGASAARRGVRVVDAPVSGGATGAAGGSLAIMVRGVAEAFTACSGPLGLVAGKVVHAGPLGVGTRMKLARNLVHFASFAAVAEAQRLAEACGLDLVEIGRVVRLTDAVTGVPGAITHRDTTAALSRDDPFEIFEHVRARRQGPAGRGGTGRGRRRRRPARAACVHRSDARTGKSR